MNLIYALIAAAHVLAGAAWFGAMLYSLMILHPRARSFFGKPRAFEDFVAHIAAGARWKVLGGAAFIALTGLALLGRPTTGPLSSGKWICLIVKIILFLATVSLFCYASWVLWPARVMGSTEDIPRFQRRFRVIGITLLVLVGTSMVIGVVSA